MKQLRMYLPWTNESHWDSQRVPVKLGNHIGKMWTRLTKRVGVAHIEIRFPYMEEEFHREVTDQIIEHFISQK
jgi:hypothetical protein